MATVQCENRHFYDDRKHTYCPHCPVPGLKDAKTPGTQAAQGSRAGMPRTEPADSAAATGPRAEPTVRQSPPVSGMANMTVSAFRKRIGVDPVVGWLVCIKGTNKGRDYRLHSDLNKLGRDPSMDVCIEGDDTVSRDIHCQMAFSPRNKTFSVLPGTGRNLVYLNGADVYSAMPLTAYDQIDVGDTSLLFVPFCNDQFDWDDTKQQDTPKAAKTPLEPRVDEPDPVRRKRRPEDSVD